MKDDRTTERNYRLFIKRWIRNLSARLWSVFTVFGLVLPIAAAQDAFDGTTLISPNNSSNTIMVDMSGSTIKTWHGASNPGMVAYLMSDGSIIRPCQDLSGSFHGGGAGGRIQRINANDSVVWDYYCSTSTYQQHHDIQPMPNGNILMVCWESKSRAEAQAMGRVTITSSMWPTMIQEVQPSGSGSGTIVWEWHMWDHLIQDVDSVKPNYGVVADHPELLDINAGALAGGGGDWEHINSIDYNPNLDQIVLSSHNLHEIYIIDHSTTTAEAASHAGGNCGKGGDLLYRWGNPQIYDRGTATDRHLYVVHGVNWIDDGLPGAGNLLLLNNGDRSGTANDYSSAEEIVPPLLPDGNYEIAAGNAYGPDAPEWSYSDPGTFYASHLGGCYRLPNGNTLITEGTRRHVLEVSVSGTIEWEYTSTGELARVERYWSGGTPTPTPTPVKTQTATPVITATPTGGVTEGMILAMDDRDLWKGDRFYLHFTLGSELNAASMDAYVILNAGGYFWCWPSWKPMDAGLDSENYTIPAGQSLAIDVLDFDWPQVEGSASGLVFYGAAFTEGTFDLIGDVQVIEFGYK